MNLLPNKHFTLLLSKDNKINFGEKDYLEQSPFVRIIILSNLNFKTHQMKRKLN